MDPVWGNVELPSFLRMGSWIGGDRDGNPFVTADALRQALLLQSKHALGFYLDELHCLGAELSLDGRYVSVSDAGPGTGRILARSLAPSPGRALSPGHHGHLCAPCGDRRAAGAWRRGAPCGGRGAGL